MRRVDRLTVRRPVADGYMVEHIEVHEAALPARLVPVNRDGEVARFECLSTEALVERLHADAFTLEAALILAPWCDMGGSGARDAGRQSQPALRNRVYSRPHVRTMTPSATG